MDLLIMLIYFLEINRSIMNQQRNKKNIQYDNNWIWEDINNNLNN